MPAKSKAQQRFMGMVHAAQKGDKAASVKVAKVAKRMKKKDAEDYASTKHKGLPRKVKKEDLMRLISKYGAKRVKETIMAVRPKSVTVSGSGLNRKPEEPDFEYDPEDVDEGFGGELRGKNRDKFEKARKENAEQLGYKVTGKSDTKKQTLKMANELSEGGPGSGKPKDGSSKDKEEMERKAKEQAKKDMEDEFDFDFDESINETVELIKKDNPKYKARLHQVKFAFKLAKVKLTKIKPIKARKGVVPKGHYDKSGDRLAAAWAITATDGKNTKSGELIFQDGYDGGFFIDKDFMGINVNKKNKIPRNIQRWMIGKKAHHSKGVDESVNEYDLGLTYKKGKTVKVKHKKSGKELVIIDKPNVKREYEKIGFFAEGTKRDYKDEYKKFQSSTKSKKYRAELNQYNRKKGTYGNKDGKDASHKGGKIAGFEKESTNRGRREKSRLKGEVSNPTSGIMMARIGTGHKFSSPEAKTHVDKDVTTMSKFLGKASQQVIKTMMNGVKGGKYNAMDLARGIQVGPANRTHYGETDFIQQLWDKVREKFRRYSPSKKLS